MEKIKFNKIVIWGLRNRYHTHRYIHKAFFNNIKKLGYKVVWVEDDKKNFDVIRQGDLVISSEVVGKMVPEKFVWEDYNLPVKEGVYYCLHNYKDVFKNRINKKFLVNLQVYQNTANESDCQIGPVTFFDSKTSNLFQPWGTDLLVSEFKKPVFHKNKYVFWIGSIWNDKNNHGNIEVISELKKALKNRGLFFIRLRFVPDFLNRFFIRISRISPAISGRYQVDINYLPCRMFKNISYGQLGFSNVKKFNDLLVGANIYSENIDEMIEKVLNLSEQEYKNLVLKQQEVISKYTYKEALENIMSAFNLIKD